MKRLSKAEIFEILKRASAGESCKTLAADYDVALSTIYWTLDRYGDGVQPRNRMLSDKIPELMAMREAGTSYAEMAVHFGVSSKTVNDELNRIGLEYSEAEKAEQQLARNRRNYANTEADIVNILREHCPSIEYVSGYMNNHAKMTVRCVECGRAFDASLHTLVYGSGQCPLCREDRRTSEREAKVAAIAAKKAVEAERRRAETEQRIKDRAEARRVAALAKMHTCPVCGNTTANKIYCSASCRNRAKNSRKDAMRRSRMRNACVDRDITLEALFKRDAGICHICGGQCSLEDYVIVDDTFIAGNWYPSIDHVVPLAKGGQHSWANVKLAHRVCNTAKGTLDHPPGVP